MVAFRCKSLFVKRMWEIFDSKSLQVLARNDRFTDLQSDAFDHSATDPKLYPFEFKTLATTLMSDAFADCNDSIPDTGLSPHDKSSNACPPCCASGTQFGLCTIALTCSLLAD